MWLLCWALITEEVQRLQFVFTSNYISKFSSGTYDVKKCSRKNDSLNQFITTHYVLINKIIHVYFNHIVSCSQTRKYVEYPPICKGCLVCIIDMAKYY